MRERRPRHNNRDRLPKGMRNRFFKDPAASAEKFGEQEHAVESACDFAWCDQRVRQHLREWLAGAAKAYARHDVDELAPSGGATMSFELRTGHGGVTVRAVFARDTRLVGDRLVAVVFDPRAPKTIYCGAEMPCPPPLLAATLTVVRV